VTSPGVLYVVATPIGNLDDISLRARDVLKAVRVVAAEDTRRTATLLAHLGLRCDLVSLHEHNERAQVPVLLRRLAAGESLALVSDAGTPLISDPGYRLVSEARRAGISVQPIPGPCAAIAALSAAGLPSDRFRFEGFLPARAAARRARLEALRSGPETIIFYEAVHRVPAMLADAAEVLGAGRAAAVARELTKLHEAFYCGSLAEVRAALAADPGGDRGEFVVLVAGAPGADVAGDGELERVAALLAAELPAAQAAGLAARITGRSRRDAYAAVLRHSGRDGGGQG
jgi:16S rRNA (cytidine1402-2'-O)-methyltransferase